MSTTTLSARRLDPAWLVPGADGALAGLRPLVHGDGLVLDRLREDLAELMAPAPADARAVHIWALEDPSADLPAAPGTAAAAGHPAAADLPAAAGALEERLRAALAGRGADLPAEGFAIHRTADGDVLVCGAVPASAMHGAYAARRLAEIPADGVLDLPATRWRTLDHWDNFSASDAMGSVERGYAGASILWEEGALTGDLERLRAYARLLGAAGITSITPNNVNVHAAETHLLTDRRSDLVRIAEVLRPYGIALLLCINYAAPVSLGELDTADPLDPQVARWWRDAADALYADIPDLAGVVVKADSEGRPGPFTYGRTQADGANMLGAALAPHGGTVLWRCFVYDAQQDWRDRTTDRARAAYDHFLPLDGQFADNVVLQIKHGPMDFQVREPVSPLLFALRRTRFVVELQVTQEYTGQQKHLVHLAPLWRDALDTVGGGRSLAQIIGAGDGACGGIAAVANVGDSPSWTGHPFAQANLFALARLAWDPQADAGALIREWIATTYPQLDEHAAGVLARILDGSWRTYEMYTAPLGIGWMVQPGHHYGPSVDGYEYDRWGTYHRADRDGIGMDRTAATGTGYVELYPEDLAARFRDVETCEDEHLLFFHHVPYTHRLHDGSTVIQSIYDTHIEGYERAAAMREDWGTIAEQFPAAVREEVDARFSEQLRSAREWRDQICTSFLRRSGIPDEKGREIPA